MIALQRHSYSTGYVKPVAGLAAAASLAVLLFASGLAAMDHMAGAAQRSTVVLSGSFDPVVQSDYRTAAPQRFAPQRATTR
jgi:hypothetical protein